MPTAQSNGLTLTYDVVGNSNDPAILLIMGLGMQLTGWPDSFCQRLADHGFYVIRFDNRDVGFSTRFDQAGVPNIKLALLKVLFHWPIKSAYTLDDMAADAIGLLDALNIQKAHIAGASMGGMIAQIVAAKYPQRTLSLTSIMSTTGRRGLPGPTREATKALLARPDDPANQESVIQHYMRTAKILGSPKYPIPEPVLRQRISTSVNRSVSIDGTARQLHAVLACGDRRNLIRNIHVPTLVIHGKDDPLVPIAGGRDTAASIPGAVMQEIDGMGHNLPPDLDDKVAGLIAGHCHNAASK